MNLQPELSPDDLNSLLGRPALTSPTGFPIELVKPGKENSHNFHNSPFRERTPSMCWKGWWSIDCTLQCMRGELLWLLLLFNNIQQILRAYHKLTSEKVTCSLQSHSFTHSENINWHVPASLGMSIQVSFRNSCLKSFLRATIRYRVWLTSYLAMLFNCICLPGFVILKTSAKLSILGRPNL